MDNAIYTATAGMLTRARALDVTANNLANINTPGYKRQTLITSTFQEHMTYRLSNGQSDQVGATTYGALAAEVFSYEGQGNLWQTDRALDLTIAGDGFFTIANPDGSISLTRNGQFGLNPEGFLVSATGGFVLGVDGPIQLGGASDVTVMPNGQIQTPEGVAANLRVVTPENPAGLAQNADGTFVFDGTDVGFTGQVLQNQLETSNVDVLDEMISMMEASRAFQMCSQAIRMLDSVNQKTTTEIGRV
jgi:flagellar basal-body rod protein FlgG